MNRHKIDINVMLDNEKMPEHIDWSASGAGMEVPNNAKAMMLAFWDGKEKTAMRIDLWTKRMMVDEMNDFFYQTMMTMADTFQRATRNESLASDFKTFAKDFKTRADAALENAEAKGQS